MKRVVFPILLLSSAARAEVIPQPSGGDTRVLSAPYSADQVVVLRVAVDTALAVEFAPTEHIENVAVGTTAGWQITPNKRGDHLFIKSSGEAAPTNLIVVTDAREYLFSLVPGDNRAGLAPYIVRFTFPAADGSVAAAPASPGIYRLSGSREIRPKSISDDGKATSITWDEEAPIPAIYALDTSGQESLVNGAMRDGVYVIDAIAPRYVFRSGKLKASAVRKREKRQ